MKTRATPFREVAVRALLWLRDERGVAMAEYLLVTMVLVPLVIIVFHPDNGLYQAARSYFDRTALMVQFPGP